jgi:hypothetical protein
MAQQILLDTRRKIEYLLTTQTLLILTGLQYKLKLASNKHMMEFLA